MRYGVYLYAKHSEPVLLSKTRRKNGAINELMLHVESKRKVLKRKAKLPDRVVTGPINMKGAIEAVAVVYILSEGKPSYSIYFVKEIYGGNG